MDFQTISDLQAVNQKAATQNEKTEKLTVIQKLEEAEQELKVFSYYSTINQNFKNQYFQILSYTEILAEKVCVDLKYCWVIFILKTLYQLQWENDLLRQENQTLIKVLAKMKK